MCQGCPRARQVWGLLFQRLQSARTPKFVRGFLAFLAGFILRHGATATAASIDAVQSGLFTGGVLAQARFQAVPLLLLGRVGVLSPVVSSSDTSGGRHPAPWPGGNCRLQ